MNIEKALYKEESRENKNEISRQNMCTITPSVEALEKHIAFCEQLLPIAFTQESRDELLNEISQRKADLNRLKK